MPKQQKRYQYWSSDGIQWSDWFDYNGIQELFQLGKKLKNDYRTV